MGGNMCKPTQERPIEVNQYAHDEKGKRKRRKITTQKSTGVYDYVQIGGSCQ